MSLIFLDRHCNKYIKLHFYMEKFATFQVVFHQLGYVTESLSFNLVFLYFSGLQVSQSQDMAIDHHSLCMLCCDISFPGQCHHHTADSSCHNKVKYWLYYINLVHSIPVAFSHDVGNFFDVWILYNTFYASHEKRLLLNLIMSQMNMTLIYVIFYLVNHKNLQKLWRFP